MKLNVTKTEGAVLVDVTDEIVTRDDQQQLSEVVEAKLAEGERSFVIDLTNVPYVGSLGIAVLVAAYVKVSRSGGTLRLVNPRPRVSHVLQMTKVADIFRTYASVEEALTAS